MKRLALILASTAAAALLALPAYATGDPGGAGLFREHYSTCTASDGSPFFAGYITLVRGAGTSFWVGGHHLVIQSFQTAAGDQNGPTGAWSAPYTFGMKTGPGSGLTVTCQGYFPPSDSLDGYWVRSYDVLVP